MSSKIYNCSLCLYNTDIKFNFNRHMVLKHTNNKDKNTGNIIGIPNKYIGQETLTWVLMTPVLALINKHIRTTANAFSAQIVDLFHGQLDSSDIVYNIEPGKTASPKIAALMAEVASTFVNQ